MKPINSKAELWLQKVAFENPEPALRWGHDAARTAMLVEVFYSPGWRWIDGQPCHLANLTGRAGAHKSSRSLARIHWISPIKANGEDTVEGFLKNNLAAQSFVAALTQTLAMARRPKKEAMEIVRRAAEKMHPDYMARVRALSKQASKGVSKCDVLENVPFPVPSANCLLANLPDAWEEEWSPLIHEALALPKKISDAFGQKASPQTKEARKWTEKVLRSLKRKGLAAMA